ncbi:hypothetical protein [Xanthomonas albilineans]|nr:hypothetical protein [Xanthomonas albilineans]
MYTHSTIRNFRKAAICTVLALAAGASTSGSAQVKIVSAITKNYDVGAKSLMIQVTGHHSNTPGCVQLVPPTNNQPGYGRVPILLVGSTYDVYAMRDDACNSYVIGSYVTGYNVNSTRNLLITISKELYDAGTLTIEPLK